MHEPPVTAFLLNSLEIGGSEVKTVQLVNRLSAQHRSVHLLYLNPPAVLRNRLSPNVPVTCLDRVGKLSVPALRRLHKYVSDHGVRTVVAVNLYPQLYGAVTRELAGRRIRSIVTINTTDHSGVWERMQMAIYAPLLRRADAVIFGSLKQMRTWIDTYRLPEQKCRVIYNGVDVVRFAPGQVDQSRDELRKRLGLTPLDVIIGTVGRLQPEKNQLQLIAALQRLKVGFDRLKLLIVGEGAERAELEARAAREGMCGRVLFAGRLDDVRPAVDLMDIFVLPSVSVETFSNAALEAMAMGKPVVLSDIGGAGEMIVPGISGYICHRGDLDSLTEQLRKLLEDAEERARIGRNARDRVVTKFSMESMVAGFESLLWPV
jgi:glycosyltransferase involved in cell wall biosynthesis